MLDFYKRVWEAFLPTSVLFCLFALQAIYNLGGHKYQVVVITVMLILAMIFLITGTVAYILAFKLTREEKVLLLN